MSKAAIEVLRQQGWTVPEGYTPDNVGQCRGCLAQVLWCITPADRKAPLNRDGSSHFSNCPAAAQYRRRGTKR